MATMKLLDFTYADVASNLALDEVLLDEAERAAELDPDGEPAEVLRFWEPLERAVVIGRSSEVESECNLTECARRGIPILRRTSGGAAIVTGPGCLMYAVVLSYRHRPDLRFLERAHAAVLETQRRALASLGLQVEIQGTSDLAMQGRKFSGNSLRCRRGSFIYHGTLLHHFPLDEIAACLAVAPRQPAYRAGRTHREFVTNLPVTAADLRRALVEAWQAMEPYGTPAHDAVARLAAEKFNDRGWTYSR